MEKFDTDDESIDSGEQTGSLEVLVPEDDVYSPSEEEQAAFVADAAPSTPTEASDDPRSSYGSLPTTEWPVYNYETSGGKTIAIKHDALGTFWRIEFVPGGQLPAELQGRFTNDTEAKFAVEQYLAKQD